MRKIIDEEIKLQRKLELHKLGEHLRLNTRIKPIKTKTYSRNPKDLELEYNNLK